MFDDLELYSGSTVLVRFPPSPCSYDDLHTMSSIPPRSLQAVAQDYGELHVSVEAQNPTKPKNDSTIASRMLRRVTSTVKHKQNESENGRNRKDVEDGVNQDCSVQSSSHVDKTVTKKGCKLERVPSSQKETARTTESWGPISLRGLQKKISRLGNKSCSEKYERCADSSNPSESKDCSEDQVDGAKQGTKKGKAKPKTNMTEEFVKKLSKTMSFKRYRSSMRSDQKLLPMETSPVSERSLKRKEKEI